MSATADTIFGTTVTFGTSSFAAKVLDVSWDGVSRAAIDTTHHGTTVASTNEVGGKTYIPAGISDGGSLTLEIQYNPDDDPPMDGAAETITVTFPFSGGDSSVQPKIAFSGFATDYSMSGNGLETVATASLTVKVSGVVTLTAGS